MLINDYFKIKEIQTGEKYLIDIELNPKHEIYKGHFPGNPVAPGVCLTQMVKETVEHILNKKLTMVTGDNIKFTAILNPEETPNVQLALALKTKENGLLQADGNVKSGEVSYFSIKASYKEG